jgi:hypothetical protein
MESANKRAMLLQIMCVTTWGNKNMYHLLDTCCAPSEYDNQRDNLDYKHAPFCLFLDSLDGHSVEKGNPNSHGHTRAGGYLISPTLHLDALLQERDNTRGNNSLRGNDLATENAQRHSANQSSFLKEAA